jgi:hypothetical protein
MNSSLGACFAFTACKTISKTSQAHDPPANDVGGLNRNTRASLLISGTAGSKSSAAGLSGSVLV